MVNPDTLLPSRFSAMLFADIPTEEWTVKLNLFVYWNILEPSGWKSLMNGLKFTLRSAGTSI